MFVNTVLATGQGEGAVSWLNLTFRLMYLPIGLFGVSIATATVPAISRQLALGDKVSVRRTISDGLVLMMMLNVPATVGLILLAELIIRLLYERGQFLPSDTIAAAAALQFYAIGLLGYSVVRIASPAFYALGQSRVPVAVSFIAVLANAALNVWLVQVMDTAGWPWARRSPRCSTPRCCSSCCAGGSAASMAGPSPAPCCGLRWRPR